MESSITEMEKAIDKLGFGQEDHMSLGMLIFETSIRHQNGDPK